MRAAICLLWGVLWLVTTCAFATVEGWEIVGDPSRVAINFSSNHGYYTRDIPYSYRHQVAALEAVQRDLVLKGKLQAEPILIRVPDLGFGTHPRQTKLTLQHTQLIRGDSEFLFPARRYQIEIADESRPKPSTPAFFDDLLVLTLTLQKLPGIKGGMGDPSLPLFRKQYSQDIARYQNIAQHFDPIWSPDSRLLVYTIWQRNRAEFRVLDPARRRAWKLEPLRGYMTSRPIWSPNGKYLAYADLKDVKIFETATRRTYNVNLPFDVEEARNEVLLAFERGRVGQSSLLMAADASLFNDYRILRYDLETHRIMSQTTSARCPSWAKRGEAQERLVEGRRAVSPIGDWVAMITERRGLRRLVLRSRDGDQNLEAVALPATAVSASMKVETEAPPHPQSTLRPAPVPDAMPEREAERTPVLLIAALVGAAIAALAAWLVKRRKTKA
jgi:hypothetical protein